MRKIGIGDKIVHIDKDGRKHLLRLIEHSSCELCFFSDGTRFAIFCRNDPYKNGSCIIRNSRPGIRPVCGAFVLLKSQKRKP